jgi:hypothetical protein
MKVVKWIGIDAFLRMARDTENGLVILAPDWRACLPDGLQGSGSARRQKEERIIKPLRLDDGSRPV